LTGAVIDQSGQKFSDMRSNSSLSTLLTYQNESHNGGIIGGAGALALGVDDAFVIGSFSSAATCVQLSPGDAVYVDGYRGTSVIPTYKRLGQEYGYVGFDSLVDTQLGVYSIFVNRNTLTGKFFIDKIYGTAVPTSKALIGTVYWNGSVLSSQPFVDQRTFGLTGTNNIKNGSITSEKLAGNIDPAKLSLPSTNIFVGSAANAAAAVAMSGDAMIDTNGVLTIADEAITVDKLGVRSVVPTKLDDTKTFTVNGLVSKTGIQIQTGTISIPPQGAAQGWYLICGNATTGEAMWQAPPQPSGQTPAPIRWVAQGEMMTAQKVVQALIEGPMTITSVHLNLGTAPVDNTVQIDITNTGQSIFSGPLPSYTTGIQGNKLIDSNFNTNAVLSAGQILSLNINVTGTGVNTGADLLVTIGFATIT
jgi:hypothetical protein